MPGSFQMNMATMADFPRRGNAGSEIRWVVPREVVLTVLQVLPTAHTGAEVLDSNEGLSSLRTMREVGTETETPGLGTVPSLKHKADNCKATGGTSFHILTQCIPESHDSLKPSKAKPPRPQPRLDCAPAQHSCPYLSLLGSLLRPEGKVSASCHGRARVDGQNKLTAGLGLNEKGR